MREADGLAMSSRNAYLSDAQRTAAAGIYATLEAARGSIEAGERDAEVIRNAMRKSFAAEPLFELNYAEVVDTESFTPVDRIESDVILPVAVNVGETRLLDNVKVKIRP